jgi:hypothetical protein
MSERRFKIVFDKLDEMTDQEQDGQALVAEVEQLADELDEIAELRRFAEVVMDPPTSTYTST